MRLTMLGEIGGGVGTESLDLGGRECGGSPSTPSAPDAPRVKSSLIGALIEVVKKPLPAPPSSVGGAEIPREILMLTFDYHLPDRYAEQSEAIKSACRYYKNSDLCIAYIADVPLDEQRDQPSDTANNG